MAENQYAVWRLGGGQPLNGAQGASRIRECGLAAGGVWGRLGQLGARKRSAGQLGAAGKKPGRELQFGGWGAAAPSLTAVSCSACGQPPPRMAAAGLGCGLA